ncbi:hypothetical protein KY325_02420 [Candidatus Woesearchaeota archaeon]|nr:hypothetical protein [Candidatus Woesearchaeota archaeon]
MRLAQPIIQYYGLKKLSNIEQANVEKICTDYHRKIQRSLGKDTSIKVHLKTHEEGGKRKFSVILTVVAADRSFSSHLADWDLSRVLHKTFKYLNREVLRRKRTDDKGIGEKRPRQLKSKK